MNKKSSSTISAVKVYEVTAYLDTFLRTSHIKDYSCNGLQVQGTDVIRKIALVVDASMQAFELAVSNECQMIIAHHGIIWGGITNIRNTLRSQIKFLIENNLNLYASHLPLDLHPELGNNAQLAKMLQLKNLKPFGQYKGIDIGFEGTFVKPVTLDKLVSTLCTKLDSECTVLPFGRKHIRNVAVVSGGAGDTLNEAIEKEVDCYITGEPSHQNYHAALEGKINVIYAGHYHTEKAGVQALGLHLEKTFNIKTQFLDIPTTI